MNQGPFYESGTMTASVTSSTGTREACFKLGELEKRQGTVKGRRQQAVRHRKGWGEEQTRTEIRSSGPNSTEQGKL